VRLVFESETSRMASRGTRLTALGAVVKRCASSDRCEAVYAEFFAGDFWTGAIAFIRSLRRCTRRAHHQCWGDMRRYLA
jgi:hypothetical protein